ncbi:LrgB family protein [Viridibacterium curvum]|uniref:LrgB family protein n=1 Tax=Viridibacterium curvum TaxID=1101404 RepID=A0ABP9R237_9RHOO
MHALLTHPACWLTLTLLAYLVGLSMHKRCQRSAWSHPLIIAVALLLPLLWLSGISYPQYFDSARPIHLLLAPATVALAVPLYANLAHARSMLKPLLIALVVGGLCGITSALLIGQLFGLPREALLSLAPKSVTTPIAMALSGQLGGNVSLSAAVVIVTGVIGALSASPLMRWLGIRDEAMQGFAIGLSSHGIGMTRAFQISTRVGAFSGLGMSLNGIFTSLVLPLLMMVWPL